MGKIQPLGEVILPLFIHNVGTLYQNFLVAETNEPLVLGYDFFHKHQCVINLINNTLQIEGKTVDCCLESKLLSLFRIKLTETVTVPSNSEMIVSILATLIKTFCQNVLCLKVQKNCWKIN